MREQKAAYRITDLAQSERPRERLAKLGAQSLADAELLAILLRVGVQGENAIQVAQRLLTEFHGLIGLHRTPYEVMCQEHGLGPAKTAQIKPALEIGNRMRTMSPDERSTIHSPADAAALLDFDMSALEQECDD